MLPPLANLPVASPRDRADGVRLDPAVDESADPAIGLFALQFLATQKPLLPESGVNAETTILPAAPEPRPTGIAESLFPAALLAANLRDMAPAAGVTETQAATQGTDPRLLLATGAQTSPAASVAASLAAAEADAEHAAELKPLLSALEAAPKPVVAGLDAALASLKSELPVNGRAVESPAINAVAAMAPPSGENLRAPAEAAPLNPLPTAADTVQVPEGRLSDALMRLVAGGTQRAELALNPPELGSLDVSIELDGDELSLKILTANPAARDLIEQTLPRLREMLLSEGLQLGQTSLEQSDGSAPGDAERAATDAAGHGSQADGDEPGSDTDVAAPTEVGVGLIDTWA